MTTPDNPLIDAARGRDERGALLPCPFCAGVATATGPWEIGTSDCFEACIECLHCGYHLSSHDGTLFDKSKALRVATEKWNRRSSLKAQQECNPLTPDSSKVVSDEDLLRAFAGTNFGTTDYRPLLHQAVLKKACDYHCGHTITQIMKELGLIGANGRPLKKGINMLRIAYHQQMVEGP